LSYTSDELRLIFHKADLDENGVIDIDEFITLFETFTEEE
jgi:Ca2+-binding EF-hand superfamily protein